MQHKEITPARILKDRGQIASRLPVTEEIASANLVGPANLKDDMKETVLLTKKDSDEAFVTKRGKNYYIEGTKYTDDTELLLDAIKNVKDVSYDDLLKEENRSSKEQMWKTYFNHQWSDGGLILWHNPTNLWRDELARQDKLVCIKCDSKMRMYYKPYCPLCEGVTNTKKGQNYQYAHFVDLIETKYDLNLRDYGASKHKVRSSSGWNVDHEMKWEDKHFPIPDEYLKPPFPKGYRVNQAGIDWFRTREGKEFEEKRNKAYRAAPDGKCKEIPYWDFWHFMLDKYFHGDISNDCIRHVNWQEVREEAREEWQQEIADLFVKEFGDKDYRVEISW